jgi:dimeric dUTPase (all-alpha-NTP-PPase superfamily)
MPNFLKKFYKLFIWISDIREIYVKLFTNVIKLFINFRKKLQISEEESNQAQGRARSSVMTNDGVRGCTPAAV